MDAGRCEIVDLRKVAARDLDALLQDEICEWQRELEWDFAPSAELVRQYAGTNTLAGAALRADGQVAGYGYVVLEEPRAIIGDVYVRPRWRNAATQTQVFRAMLDAVVATPRVARMESQLMLVSADAAAAIQAQCFGHGKPVRIFGRRLMSHQDTSQLPEREPALHERFRLERWSGHMLQTAGAIIAESYKGQADSEINAQYGSPGGARRFLTNIVEFPGCGTFHPAASFVAFERTTGNAAGMVLASFVASDVGHVAQLCVMPGARGTGLGRALLRESLTSLYEHHARCVSLTVTEANRVAISLYGQFGFRIRRNFFAYIWEA